MPSKFRQRCWLWLSFFCLGLLIVLFPNWYEISPGLAAIPPTEITAEKASDAKTLETRGKELYLLGQFDRAIELWQQANLLYQKEGNNLGQGSILSNLALAYSQINDWAEAHNSITRSLQTIERASGLNSEKKLVVLAQIYNNQGILELNQGKAELAIAAWERARINYRLIGDELGVIRASINQASAFKELGLYRRAVNSLSRVEESLVLQPDSIVKATGLRSYGQMLRLVGDIERSRKVLQVSLATSSNLDNPQEKAKTLVALGNTYKTSQSDQALEFYALGKETCALDANCQTTALPLQIDLARLNLLVHSPEWHKSSKLIASIEEQFTRLPDNRTNIDRKINFANVSIELNRKILQDKQAQTEFPNWQEIDRFLEETIAAAKLGNYPKAVSYGWGLRGQIAEELEAWELAQKYTQKALILGQKINAAEIVYLWQWQLGRIEGALNERPQAIAHYTRAVEILKSLSQDLVAIDSEVQYSFREGVEPVYRQLVSLLLTDDGGGAIAPANLEGARETIESLQLAELNNFFREACLENRIVDIDRLDRQAAVIYPIILDDRLEVILSLPNRPLQHYTTKINREQLETIIREYRQSIVIRSRRHFYTPAAQLYDLLIRPALPDLTANQIKTLVFVPDGSLRSVPLSALYDGQQYLLENYNVALTPGLQLLAPRPLEKVSLKTIAVGLTEGRQGFSPLDYVDAELETIQANVESKVLVDRDFTNEALKEEIEYSDYPIVHIATHGQFSSSIEDTFLLTWDDRINIEGLDKILQTRNLQEKKAIELLVLSACETAAGDDRAALGLAGIAVRAGARSTLATLWSVNDRATAEMMSDFYQELSDKHSTKADAVRQAQLSLLHNPKYEHPFYWAAYVLLGNWL